MPKLLNCQCLILSCLFTTFSFRLVENANGQVKLPPESILPGEVDENKIQEKLPDESQLPNLNIKVSIGTAKLPAESIVPGVNDAAMVARKVQEKKERELDERPWLRLLDIGATSPLRSITFSSDSKRILAGGLDKAVHVWKAADARDRSWVYETRLYWRVERSNRGLINSIAANDSLIAFAGYGYTVSQGDIGLYDADTLKYESMLLVGKDGNPDSISSIALPQKKNHLATIDWSGRVNVWSRSQEDRNWRARKIRGRDVDRKEVPSPEVARKLRNYWRQYGNPVATSSNGDVVYPELMGKVAIESIPRWKLVRWSPATDTKTDILAPSATFGFSGAVARIGISSSGDRIVAVDARSNSPVYCFDKKSVQLAPDRKPGTVTSLALSSSGKFIAVGSSLQLASKQFAHRIDIWRWLSNGKPALVATFRTSRRVYGMAISPDEKHLAYCQGNSVLVHPLDAVDRPPVVLGSRLISEMDVAFENAEDSYEISIRDRSSKPKKGLRFKTADLKLEQIDAFKESEWNISGKEIGVWKIDGNDIDGYQVLRSGKPVTRFGGQYQPSAFCWIPDPSGKRPLGLAVGTRGQNQIYLYRIDDKNNLILVRLFRGHFGALTSISHSHDRRYLVSSARDSTVRFWKIGTALSDKDPENLIHKWGAELEVKEEDGKPVLRIKSLLQDGPFYFRGFRKGDSIDRIEKGVEEEVIADAKDILQELSRATRNTLFIFHSSRGGKKQKPFSLFPAWQPLASFVWNHDREWAFWSPYGYYDASFNGHKIFGWQVNRSSDVPPEIFRAAELKEEFERPEVMEGLLQAGSLAEAFGKAARSVPGNLSDRLAATNRLRPRINILSPNAGKNIDGDRLKVTANVRVPVGVVIVPPKAFANGVPAVSRKQISVQQAGNEEVKQFEWEFALPSDRRIKIQTVVSSDQGLAAISETFVERSGVAKPNNGRIFLVATGVNEYQDRRIQNLDFAVTNARMLTEKWQKYSPRLDTRDTVVLTDEGANRSLWNATISQVSERLRVEATSDDLLVIFLSGHGYRDEASKQYFYLTSGTDYGNVLGRRYSDCISFDDLARLANVPCRKLVVLDTCHSGALQTLKQRDLKSVVRALENDLVITITASEGGQKAYESTDEKMGVFTAGFIQALQGGGDEIENGGDGDGKTSLAEVVRYLKKKVPSKAAEFGALQNPTASPSDLIPLMQVPLSTLSR